MRNIVLIVVIMIFCSGCTNDRNYKEIDVISASGHKTDNWYSESNSVFVDEATISNREACVYEIIRRVVADDFKEIDFSFEENGYPNELSVTVYTSKQAFEVGIKAFEFEYVTEYDSEKIWNQNNIKDNPDKFLIVYEKAKLEN